ncbi:pilus assembly protein N-terminal domain-containing protein [Flaviflagellibacter deserti]|uniref:Pilus assembly protein N-terminal domain-containing protein n=1 Tax=Flaviflagellibacter deserti TaxID=2267266 RepID=A0ABV9Z3U5_9HYPH
MDVALDLASLLHVPPKTAMIVIGNPSIADTTEPRNGFVVVTGKGYGTTNLLALDASGAVLLETMIHVRRASERTLTVLRGAARETYSCTPRCEQTVTLGDAPDFFGGSSGQIGSRVGLATGGAGGGGSQSGGSPN